MTKEQIRQDYIRKFYPDLPNKDITTIARNGIVTTTYSDHLESLLIQVEEMILTLKEMQNQVCNVEFYYINAIKHLDEDQINDLLFMIGSYIKQSFEKEGKP